MTPIARTALSFLGAGALAAGGAVGGYLAHGSGDDASTVTVAASAAQPVAASTTDVGRVYRSSRGGIVEISAQGFGSSGTAQGSGFVYDRAGHIVTNNHVVAGADSVSVRFDGGKSVHAQVVAADPSTDLALLKVAALPSGVHPLATAASDAVGVGDPVIAIGSPFGLEGTVTSGIVSAVGRSISAPDNYVISGAIQTDAAINHGNSGGPLLDAGGRVIGVTSQIESESGGNNGVGFAIPSNTVRRVMSQLLSSGHALHAFLGVSLGDGRSSAKIEQVQPDSPADRAGVRTGDGVIELDGKRIRSADDLRAAIEARKPGTKVELKVVRGGTTKTIRVTLGNRPTA